MKLHVTTAIGRARTELAAFDRAMVDAGVADRDIVRFSAVIPPGAEIVHGNMAGAGWSERACMRVYAAHTVSRLGDQTWAGVGWVQDACTGQGLFVEHGGARELAVRRQITASLEELQRARGRTLGPVHIRVVGATCTGAPTCALVICAYGDESGPCR